MISITKIFLLDLCLSNMNAESVHTLSTALTNVVMLGASRMLGLVARKIRGAIA